MIVCFTDRLTRNITARETTHASQQNFLTHHNKNLTKESFEANLGSFKCQSFLDLLVLLLGAIEDRLTRTEETLERVAIELDALRFTLSDDVRRTRGVVNQGELAKVLANLTRT